MRLGWKVFIPLTIIWLIILGFAQNEQIGGHGDKIFKENYIVY